MTSAQQEIKALKKDIAELKTLLADKAEDVLPNGSGHGGMSDMDELRARARQAGRKTRAYLKEKQQQAKDVRDGAEKAIQERPFTATAAAFASGAVIGALLRRH